MVNGSKELFHYSFTTNTWIQHTVTSTATPNLKFDIHWNAIAMDSKENKIYRHYRDTSLAIFTLNHKDQAKLEIITDLDEISDSG